jgi:hypothetical protein
MRLGTSCWRPRRSALRWEIRITAVTTTAGGVLRISGRVKGRLDGVSSLRPGETRTIELSIDRKARQVRANFLGDEVILDLEHPSSPSTSLA